MPRPTIAQEIAAIAAEVASAATAATPTAPAPLPAPAWDLEYAPRTLECVCCRTPIARDTECWIMDGEVDVVICRECGTPRAMRAA